MDHSPSGSPLRSLLASAPGVGRTDITIDVDDRGRPSSSVVDGIVFMPGAVVVLKLAELASGSGTLEVGSTGAWRIAGVPAQWLASDGSARPDNPFNELSAQVRALRELLRSAKIRPELVTGVVLVDGPITGLEERDQSEFRVSAADQVSLNHVLSAYTAPPSGYPRIDSGKTRLGLELLEMGPAAAAGGPSGVIKVGGTSSARPPRRPEEDYPPSVPSRPVRPDPTVRRGTPPVSRRPRPEPIDEFDDWNDTAEAQERPGGRITQSFRRSNRQPNSLAAFGRKVSGKNSQQTTQYIAIGAVVVVLIIILLLIVKSCSGGGGGTAASTSPSVSAPPASVVESSVEPSEAQSSAPPAAAGLSFTDTGTTGTVLTVPATAQAPAQTPCADHATGAFATALTSAGCIQLDRALVTANSVGGQPAIADVTVATFPSEQGAVTARTSFNTSGTGNFTMLLAENKTYPGAPAQMPKTKSYSVTKGNQLIIIQAAYTGTEGSATALNSWMQELATRLVLPVVSTGTPAAGADATSPAPAGTAPTDVAPTSAAASQ